jgi:choice-of-anchor A domain-containing protein
MYKMPSFRNGLLVAVALPIVLGAFPAKADLLSCGVDLGAAGRTKQWAIFTLGSGVDQNVDISGPSSVTGDVGAAGIGNVNMSGTATINGDLYEKTGGRLTTSGRAKVTGNTHQNAASDALLNQAVIDANNASDQAFALPVTPQYASLTSVNLSGRHDLTITGSDCVVLKLTDFVLSGSSTFTLQGTAGTSFIINVTGQFSLSGSSKIVLGLGINPQDVLFNIRGTGSQVSLSGRTRLSGILLATKRTVSIGPATVQGEVIANAVSLHSGGRVVTPTTNP